ncbi:MAG: hypothetical protein HOC74_28330 [Gemmatimonadetes bacterium]|jgi:hypothetical protein|nr:hypothetical protein [Gemmatimonadota bacterium]
MKRAVLVERKGILGFLGAAVLLGIAVWSAEAGEMPTQKQVPIPGLTLEESVRLETASEKLQELAIQRDRKNGVRREEVEKLIKPVEEAVRSGDDMVYQTGRERLVSYIFAANNQDHRDLSQIVYTIKETQVLTARARIALEELSQETGRDSGLSGLMKESNERFQKEFVEPNQREIVLVSELLTGSGLDPEEEKRLDQHLGQLVTFGSLMEEWQQPLEEMPYLPTQIDPAFSGKEAIEFLDGLSRHLRFDYKDLEVQLFWSEILAEIGRRYAAGKLPLVRVQVALNRLSRLSGNFPQMDGKPWFMGALGQLASAKGPRQKAVWQIPKRVGGDSWMQRRTESGESRTPGRRDPEELLEQIHENRSN